MAINNLDPNPKSSNYFSSMSRTQKIMLLALLPIAGFSILPIIFILLIGLLPTLTVMITDANNSNKLAIVGCFNVAGCFIYIFNVIRNYGSSAVDGLSGNVFSLIIMLGSAAIGILLYKELPSLFTIICKSSIQKQLKNIDDKLAQISENWGSEIISPNSSKEPHAPKSKDPNTPKPAK